MNDVDDGLDDREETLGEVESPAISSGAVLASSDWTTQTILDQLKRGNIDLNPIFQRRDAWRPLRKSQFIESLVLGLPIPQLVLAERKEKRGTYLVVDGKQRLLTLSQFAAGPDSQFQPFQLQGLRMLPELNGLTYNELSATPDLDGHLTAFDNQTIRTVVIKNWPGENFLYTVFLRLNSGSLPLSPQELRQALHPGQFTLHINLYSEANINLKAVLGLETPDFRMRDTELVIRYLAFRNFMSDYTGNLKPLLDRVVVHFNEKWDSEQPRLASMLEDFDRAVATSIDIFGPQSAFRKWSGQRFEVNINRAVFDVMVHTLHVSAVAEAALANRENVITAFKRLCVEDEEFRSSIEGTTKSIQAIRTRLTKWTAALGIATQTQISLPVLPGGRGTIGR